YETGCRPSEAYNMASRYYHEKDHCFIYPGKPKADEFVWKNAKRTGKDRAIYLTAKAIEVVERLLKQYPDGPIFRTRRRTPWKDKSAATILWRLRDDLGIAEEVTPYSFRHTYATDFLLRGGSI